MGNELILNAIRRSGDRYQIHMNCINECDELANALVLSHTSLARNTQGIDYQHCSEHVCKSYKCLYPHRVIIKIESSVGLLVSDLSSVCDTLLSE